MYALVHNNQVVVGPRQWSAAFFIRWLSDNLNLENVVLKEEQVPIVIDASTKLLKVTSLIVPECNHKIQQFSGPHWTIHSTHITGEYTLVDKEVNTVKNELKNLVAAKRYEKEIGGLDLGDGTIIRTDPESQAKLTGAWARVQRKPNTLIDWKGSNGWVKLNKTAIENLADAIGDHVQACFTAEKDKIDEIDACTSLQELDAINLEL